MFENQVLENRIDVNSPIFRNDAFSRLDEKNDAEFYEKDRFVQHLDGTALDTIELLIGQLVYEENPVILDLMASWDSHIPESLEAARTVGLGMNKNELSKNKALSEYVIHDLNENPKLPFSENTFDAVINTVSVDYMTKPVEVFMEVGRILKPGGLFLVIFSNRLFPQKAVKIWREASEEERVILVHEFFKTTGVFKSPIDFVSIRKPRPEDDKYADLGIPSDPVYAVYADKKGGQGKGMRRPQVTMHYGEKLSRDEMERRKATVKDTLRCPHCEEPLKKWEVPDNPFCQTWDNDFMYICFNDRCPYYVRGWDFMCKEGNRGTSYRFMFNPEKNCCMPIPVQSPRSLKDGIMSE